MVHRVFNSAQYLLVNVYHVVNGGQYVKQMARSVDYSADLVNTALESKYWKPKSFSTGRWGSLRLHIATAWQNKKEKNPPKSRKRILNLADKMELMLLYSAKPHEKSQFQGLI